MTNQYITINGKEYEIELNHTNIKVRSLDTGYSDYIDYPDHICHLSGAALFSRCKKHVRDILSAE